MTTGTERPALEVADVIRLHGETFLAKHGRHLRREQRRALRDLAACRTAALGGHVERCLDCGHERIAYNSCRNRHCPKCQTLARARWLEREAQYLLPVEYHHVVFTLPAELSDLALANPTVVYERLFQAAAATLRDVAANPKRLGAAIGVLMVLHTWGQNLHHHPHVHCVVTGGGLSCDPRGVVAVAPRWVACRPGFFLPVRVLSRLFRGKFLALLRTAFDGGRLIIPDRLTEAGALTAWLATLFAQEWVVYAKRPFGGPAQVLKYLARYTHRVAISNRRLVHLSDERVTFRYTDYADDRRAKVMTLDADEFLRRFVQHVLPKGFVKVRHYGLLANRRREEWLAVCRRLLFVATVVPSPVGDAVRVEPSEPPHCPQCGGVRFGRHDLEPDQVAIAAPDLARDTS
jgi:hypothetical protein